MDSLDLPWLPPVAADFGEQVRSLRQARDFEAARFRRLATARLNVQQLSALARALPKSDDALDASSLRLRVLSNATSDLLLPTLSATAPRHGLWVKATAGPFGTYLQEALDPQSETNLGRPDIVLLALDQRAIDLAPCPGNLDKAQQSVGAALARLLSLADALQRANNCLVVLQTLATPPGTLFGSLDAQLPGTLRWQIEEFNRSLRRHDAPSRLTLDVAALAAAVGQERWDDPSLWSLAKIPYSQRVIPLYADHLCRLLMAAYGKAKKCLVLDLDNTLWGGIIGDDGLAGIVIGQGSPLGEAHLAVQAAALALRERGIILAVSSKNDDLIARLPFREHPEMLLREEHFAAFQANWQDKPANLRAIAKALNIGVDALVLLDDNPVERLQVREALPDVGVPELPDQPELFASTIMAAGYFEAVQFTDEDRERAAQYQANAMRSAPLETTADLNSHLASLDMVAAASPFDAVGRTRITQLINKTNQFNLTTRRRTELEVAALERDPTVQTLQVRLKDRFGDNGIISIVICLPESETWQIDTWLMSCRVLNRGVEQAVLNVLVGLAKQRGVSRLVGRYVPTDKNGLVKDHYKTLGFAERSTPAGATEWVLDVARYHAHETQIIMNVATGSAADRP